MRPASVIVGLGLALVVGACGGSDGSEGGDVDEDANGANGSAASPAADLPTSATHRSTDDPETTYLLQGGRYRLSWQTPGCERVEVTVTQTDGPFTYTKAARAANFNSTVNDLLSGAYKFDQVDPDCPEWSVRIDRMAD